MGRGHPSWWIQVRYLELKADVLDDLRCIPEGHIAQVDTLVQNDALSGI